MQILGYILGVMAAAALLVLLVAYLCFRKAFYVSRRAGTDNEEIRLPDNPIYQADKELLTGWIGEMRATPHEAVQITSFDGLTLHGNYYEYAPGAPIELMFHGYRGTAESDLCGGLKRCFALGHSALIVEQRASGHSEGSVISFGINESRDCHRWLAFMEEKFGPEAQILLTGISMGAATVMMAAGELLPETVVGVLADCGYTSPRAIIEKVIRDMKIPPAPAYPFVKLGAKLFGHFDLEENSPVEAMVRCQVPILFFHGEADDYVPCYMSRENYAACGAPKKKLVTTPGAGHGRCYLLDPENYREQMKAFFGL